MLTIGFLAPDREGNGSTPTSGDTKPAPSRRRAHQAAHKERQLRGATGRSEIGTRKGTEPSPR